MTRMGGSKGRSPRIKPANGVRPTSGHACDRNEKHDGEPRHPGSIIAKEGEHEHGEGTTLADGNIVSTVVGYVHVDNTPFPCRPPNPSWHRSLATRCCAKW